MTGQNTVFALEMFEAEMDRVKKVWGRFNADVDACEGAIMPETALMLRDKLRQVTDTLVDAVLLLGE